MMARLIALLTDFGWDDPYVAELKAVLHQQWRRYPDLPDYPVIVDLCHTIPAGDVVAASWFLSRVRDCHPPGTVHLCVVDPGVGTERPVVAARSCQRHYVGPGNGLFSCLSTASDLEVVRLDNSLYYRQRGELGPAPTFHGRDIMAPVAAHLAAGVPLAQLGSRDGRAALGELPVSEDPDPQALGRVVWIDRFGNAITNIHRGSERGETLSRGAHLQVGTQVVPGPYLTYGDAPAGLPFWYWGSGECLELGLPDESAAARFGWHRGLAIHLRSP